MNFLAKLFGDENQINLKKLQPIIDKINQLEKEIEGKSDQELKDYTLTLKEKLQKGETLDSILPEAFALVREGAKRTLDQRHYDVQLIGGIILHQGKIAEMRTGEGKTLVATLAVFLNALEGKGVHVITVNDYLAKRDAVWMGQIYNFLGLTVGIITHDTSFLYVNNPKDDSRRDEVGSYKVEDSFLVPCNRKEAYLADITYGTNNEFGFDYLRDNMSQTLDRIVQRPLHFAIIDEVDSILIDESRTPLIISAPDVESPKLYQMFARIIPTLQAENDYVVDEKMKAVSITEQGIDKVEKILGVKNIYEEKGITFVHHLEQALKAEALFKKDVDYVIKDQEIIIVDQFTGRMMPGRRYSEGLHQAIEAKEGVPVKEESKTLATITFQNFFRMYDKIAGMTGTAVTSAEEFHKVYNLDVVVIPTNKSINREDLPDLVYKTEDAKFLAIAKDIRERQIKGQPVLVGTISIEKSEKLAKLLQKLKIPCNVLNAKQHEAEGLIISKAGEKGAVTIATNMAGRGVDIKLGGPHATEEEKEEVLKSGGLHVIGTERHEARRIDNQLRGRSGRQGEPGSTQFFLSLEDDVMRIFGGDRIKSLMEKFDFPDDQPIENFLISKAIESAQSKIEGYNFDSRKHLLEYDDVLNKQRQIIYDKRRQILDKKSTLPHQLPDLIFEQVYRIVSTNSNVEDVEKWNQAQIIRDTQTLSRRDYELAKGIEDVLRTKKPLDELRKSVSQTITDIMIAEYKDRLKVVEDNHQDPKDLERFVYLQTLDMLWMQHLEMIDYLKTGIRLRGYAQRDPLIEYKNEAFALFEKLLATISEEYAKTMLRIDLKITPRATHTPPTKITAQHNSHSTPPTSANDAKNSDNTPKSQKNPTHSTKVGRNDPCPCGSGKKYKKCCGQS
jgi:preprotein translocase subunit SecA